MTARKKKTLSFEEGMRSLEELVARLSNQELPLEESIALYEQGAALAAQLEQQLAAAPQAAPAAKEETPDDEIAARITSFLSGLFAHMDVEASFHVTKEDDTYSVILEGDDAGALIGRRGETLDAIQQLTGYAINHGRSRRCRIHVDAESYRARREESLERLAHKVAAKAVKYRRSVTLEPMNAYERHVIHTALQDYPNVTTHSTGTEPNRRTVVSYDPNKK